MSAAPRILLVMPRDGVYQAIISGFGAVGTALGWQTRMAFWPHGASPSLAAVRVALRDPTDVVVLAASVSERLARRHLDGRLVVAADVDLTASGIPSVVVDNAAVGQIAAEHLLDRGFRSFGAYGLGWWPFSRDRAAGFRARVEKAGCRFAGWGAARHDLPQTSGVWMHRFAHWVADLPKPAGILCCCDAWAEHLMPQCRALGVRIPEDVAIVSVDNCEYICHMLNPPVSSVMIPWMRLGNELALLADRLLHNKRGPDGPVLVGPGGVVTRQSSDTTAVEDTDVAAALAAIRAGTGRPMGVPDLLRQVPVYRQKLERKFRLHLGRTIMQTVRRAHVEQARRLLATTDLSMDQIAQRCGFSSQSKLSTTFRRETGLTPRAFRARCRALI